MEPNFVVARPEAADIDQMVPASQSSFNHRRALSDASFRDANCFDDLLLNDFDPFNFNFNVSNFSSPPPKPATGVAVGSVPLEQASGSNSMPQPAELGQKSLVDSNFRNGNAMASGGEKMVERRHRYSNSVDGSLRMPFEIEPSSLVKKAMAPEKLAELAVLDPKRAKRILANRQSAAKSKERKMRYISELEKRVLALKTQACSLSENVSILQRDNTDLSSQNQELKIRVDTLRQQGEIRNALNEAIKKELESLRNETERVAAITGYPSSDDRLSSQLSSQLSLNQHHNPPPQYLAPQYLVPQYLVPQHMVPQHMVPQQPQFYMPPPPLPPFPAQSCSGYCVPNYFNFNQLN